MRQLTSVLGLKGPDVQVYQLILARPVSSTGQLAVAFGRSADEIRESCRALVEKGLICSVSEDCFKAVPAAAGNVVERLSAEAKNSHRKRMSQISSLRTELRQLAAEGLAGSADFDPVELAESPGAAQLQIADVLDRARHEILLVHGAVRWSQWPQVWAGVGEALRGNVAVRTLLADRSEAAAASQAANDPEPAFFDRRAELRITGRMSAALFVVDSVVAVVASGSDGVAVVRNPALVSVLCALFAQSWDSAAEDDFFEGVPEKSGFLDSRDRFIVAALAKGTKDEVIAKDLALSVRTVRRKISKMMEHLGAGSRFEMGVVCAQKGWL